MEEERELREINAAKDTALYDSMEWIEDGKKFRRWWTKFVVPNQVTYRSRLCMEDLICGVNPRVDKTRTAAELNNLTKSLLRWQEDCALF